MTTADELETAREDLEALLLDVLASVLAEEAMPVWDEPLPAGAIAASQLAIHDAADDSYLTVTVRIGAALAKVLASRMMTVADPSPDDVLDAVGELGNIAGGNVKSLLCQHARLSLPVAEIHAEATQADAEGVQVRAVVLGHVAELSVRPGAAAHEFYWPPTSVEEVLETQP